MGRYLSSADVSASGLAAERLRMEVAANNIANAHTTRSANGGPYRRQRVVFAEAMRDVLSPSVAHDRQLAGVEVLGVEPDPSEFPEVFDPGHPDANERGFVRMPNVRLATEMVDMITASRAYEANLQALGALRSMAENALTLLRAN